MRFTWGLLLLIRTHRLLRSVGGPHSREATVVARVLGARHVLQAVALQTLPLMPTPALRLPAVRRRVRQLGAAADAAHAASAFALAAAGRAPGTWTSDGVVASTFAGATWRTAGEPNERDVDG